MEWDDHSTDEFVKKYYPDLRKLYSLLDNILETDDEPITMFFPL